jgi:hypothetical protein
MGGDYISLGVAEKCDAVSMPVVGLEMSPDVALVGPAWSEVAYEREAVVEIGAEAVCWVIYGELWEFRDGAFYVTELFHDRRRHLVEDASCAPPGPWRHHAVCACEVCRLGTV